jgi:hypothetical protein
MRDAIRQQLILQIAEIGDRCFDPNAAGADTEKPYLVLQKGSETEDSAWTGYRRILEIWPSISRTNFQSLDSLAQKVISALEKQPLTTQSGETFTCLYIGEAGPDSVVEEWDLLTRGLRFAILAIQPVAVTETVADDPWLGALYDWTDGLLNPEPEPEWTIYLNAWPVGYKMPSVLWRLTNIKVTPMHAGLFEISKQITGHVLGRTPNEQFNVMMRLVEGLGSSVKIPLDLVNKRYLTVLSSAGGYNPNAVSALKNGQIALTLKRLTSKPVEEAPPLIGNVTQKGELI